jgi:hypothetical protein
VFYNSECVAAMARYSKVELTGYPKSTIAL